MENEYDLNGDIYLNIKKTNQLFGEKEIFVFGTGLEADHFTKKISYNVTIKAYIDNYRSGKNVKFYSKDVIDLRLYLEKYNGIPIVIASHQYAMEISKQLTESGLKIGIDYFIWDESNLFNPDKTMIKYIDFSTNLWKKAERVHSARKILIIFRNKHEFLVPAMAYYANYFADKYDATIDAYIWKGRSNYSASKVIKDMYKAFNVESILGGELNEKQQVEADSILNDIWSNLETWEDYKNITIYGIRFGTTIIRTLLRFFMPSFDLKSDKMYLFLKEQIYTIVFWYHYIYENEVKTVLLADAGPWEGYIRDISVTKGIPTYLVNDGEGIKKALLNMPQRSSYVYFNEMWNQLTLDEQKYGIQWAKERISKRIQGEIQDVLPEIKNCFTFAEAEKDTRILQDNDKIKIIICPHIFEEDSFHCGEQIFDDNYFAWLCHLGELSEITPNYDWYLKPHPVAARRDFIIIDMILQKYTKIKKIPSNVSPVQLKKEGAKFALTVCGTIGHEYPAIGIQVINAGINPHSAFDFTWNPKTKEEYDNLILNLDKLNKNINEEELCKFYSMNYLFYDWKYMYYDKIFSANSIFKSYEIESWLNDREPQTCVYERYMEDWTQEKHEKILLKLDEVFKKLDEWQPNILYKRDDIMERSNFE